jgi:hypothetical protein
MERLARAPVPVLETDPADRQVRHSTILRLIKTGTRLLAGQADHVTLNGIDRWIGGVQLQGHKLPWRWDDGTETIIEAA